MSPLTNLILQYDPAWHSGALLLRRTERLLATEGRKALAAELRRLRRALPRQKRRTLEPAAQLAGRFVRLQAKSLERAAREPRPVEPPENPERTYFEAVQSRRQRATKALARVALRLGLFKAGGCCPVCRKYSAEVLLGRPSGGLWLHQSCGHVSPANVGHCLTAFDVPHSTLLQPLAWLWGRIAGR